jgi:hypothetical protein
MPIAVLVICVLGICVLQIVALGDDIRTKGQAVLKSIRFWCQAAAFALTVVILLYSYFGQKAASERQEATNERLGSNLREILKTQESEFNNQAQKLETALERLDRSLEEATNLGEAQKKQTAALDQQQETLKGLIVSQSDELKLLNRIPLNRDLLGIEFSYSPSREKWARIADAYKKIKSPEPDLPYVNANMVAERDGEHWNLDFEPASIIGGIVQTPRGPRQIGGSKKLHKLSTKNNQLFEEVIKEAMLGLRIQWGNGTNTVLHWNQDYYPSAMYISQHKIKYILRPPLILWNLNQLKHNAKISFFGHDSNQVALPEKFTICSLDPAVILKQTVQLNWSRRVRSNPPTYDELVNPQASGPHPLIVQFDVFNLSSSRPSSETCNTTN